MMSSKYRLVKTMLSRSKGKVQQSRLLNSKSQAPNPK
jgi:hypothetical protein